MKKKLWMIAVAVGLAGAAGATTIFSATTGNTTLVNNGFNASGVPALTGATPDLVYSNPGGNNNNGGFASTVGLDVLLGSSLTVTQEVTFSATVDSITAGTLQANGIVFGMSQDTDFQSASNLLLAVKANGAAAIMDDSAFVDADASAGFSIVESSFEDGFGITLTANNAGYTFALTDVITGTAATTASFSGTFAPSDFTNYFGAAHFYLTAQTDGAPSPIVLDVSVATLSVGEYIEAPGVFFEATTNNTTLFNNGVADSGLLALSGATPDLVLNNDNGGFNNGGFASTETMSTLLGTALDSTNAVAISVTVDSIGGAGELRANGITFGITGAPAFNGGTSNYFLLGIGDENSGSHVTLASSFVADADTGISVEQSSLKDGFSITLTANSSGYIFELTDIEVSGSGNTTASFYGSFSGTEFVDYFSDGHFYLAAQKWNNGDIELDISEASMAVTEVPEPSPFTGDRLEWAPDNGGNGTGLYQEANWIDPETGTAPAFGAVLPAIEVNADLEIRTGTPGGGDGAIGNLLMGSGRLSISGATLRMNSGSGIDLGASNKELALIDGKLFSETLDNATVTMQGRSELTLYGNTPLTGTTIDLQSSDCFIFFLDRIPSTVDGGYLSSFTVNGAPATTSNVDIREYYNGAAIRPKPSVPMKGFASPGLQGQTWDFSTGFYGEIALGKATGSGGNYSVTGWGSDIAGSSDEFQYLYRAITNDFEMVSKIGNVENTHANAKAGVMIRETLAHDSRFAYIYQKPDKQVNFMSRLASGGNISAVGLAGGTTSIKYVRLVRAGDVFTSYYSTNSVTGPWTELGSRTIPMTDAVYVGLAVTSHNGGEPCKVYCSWTRIYQDAVQLGNRVIGRFDAQQAVYDYWAEEDQIRSFLLKKGYMVTLSEDGAGQGFSKVYVATEADLVVDLPPELDGKVSFMRVLPWRWLAKKGWGGHNNTHMTNLGVFWSYEWEPTGSSTLDREFVPMIKGRGQDKDFRWEEVRVRGNQTHFLVFNEPMAANQGDLTVDEAIALYPKALQLGLRLGSPSRTDGANGDNWLQDFMYKADTNGYRVDFVCIHNYNKTTASALKTWLDAEYAKYGRPIWLTEFNRDNDGTTTAAQHQAYLSAVLPMLETLPYLERYAYYNFGGNNMTLFNGDNTVNAAGEIYRDIWSNPAFVADQPVDWATASLDLPAPQSVVFQGLGATIAATASLDPSVISSVEFFVDNVSVGTDSSSPFELAVDGLSQGFHTIHAVFTTTFGEQIVSSSSQVFTTRLELLSTSPAPDGDIVWSAVPGETYRVEWSPSLSNTVWNLMEDRTATGFSEQAQDASYGSDPSRFYRVKWVE